MGWGIHSHLSPIEFMGDISAENKWTTRKYDTVLKVREEKERSLTSTITLRDAMEEQRRAKTMSKVTVQNKN